jgi:hypothetical protein
MNMITEQQQVPGVNTIDGPAATTNGNNYVLAWIESDQSLWWTTSPGSLDQNSYNWASPAQIIDGASSGGPALTFFKDQVWMAWKGEGTDTRVFLASLSNSTWSAGTPIAGVTTSASPALTVTASVLYLAWKGEHDDQIYCASSSDGKNWSQHVAVKDALSGDTPALAGFKGNIYMGWKGSSDNNLWLTRFTEANGWETPFSLPSGFTSSRGPGLAFGNTGNLHVVWKGESDNSLWEAAVSTADPIDGNTHWPFYGKISVVESSARPAVAPQLSAEVGILLAWKGNSTDLWAAPLDNLAKTIPLPPGAMPFGVWTEVLPAGLPPPASTGGAVQNIEFGWGPSQFAFALSLQINANGEATFSGWYQNQGNIWVFTAPSQTYFAVLALKMPGNTVYTFSHQNTNGVPSGGIDTWDVSQTNAAIQQNWGEIAQGQVYGMVSNSVDLGSLLDQIIQDIEQIAGYVVDVVEIIS